MAVDLLPSVTDSVKRKNEEKDEIDEEVETKRIKLNGAVSPSVVEAPVEDMNTESACTDKNKSEAESPDTPVTIEEIRRLKEILRQEDAKLQLIKKIKATFISDPKKGKQAPKIEAKIKNENGMISANGKTLATTTVRIPKQGSDAGISGSTIKSIGSAFTNGSTGSGRSNSPMVPGDKGKFYHTTHRLIY
jgi:transcriptional regulator of heat shock response